MARLPKDEDRPPQKEGADQDPAAAIVANVLRCFAGLASIEVARNQLVDRRDVVLDIVRCVSSLRSCPAAVEAALVCIGQMAASPELQYMLLEVGALGHIIPLLFDYDVSLSAEATATCGVLPFGGVMSSDPGFMRTASTRLSDIDMEGNATTVNMTDPASAAFRALDTPLTRQPADVHCQLPCYRPAQ
eukprot:gene12954-5979_t